MKTPITYYGGKQSMLKFIRPLAPSHELYCEPFCGGAALFFNKYLVKVNVINDLNAELFTFYRVISGRPRFPAWPEPVLLPDGVSAKAARISAGNNNS